MVVKGTEYFDGKSRRYVDYPITGIILLKVYLNTESINTDLCIIVFLDVLQMMGRAGRPQFDDRSSSTTSRKTSTRSSSMSRSQLSPGKRQCTDEKQRCLLFSQ